jgi:hypothetical protein
MDTPAADWAVETRLEVQEVREVHVAVVVEVAGRRTGR